MAPVCWPTESDPRGLSKEEAGLDEWCKAVAPPAALRRCYGDGTGFFEEFRHCYRAEFGEPERAEALQHLRDLAGLGSLTLLTAAKHADISEVPWCWPNCSGIDPQRLAA